MDKLFLKNKLLDLNIVNDTIFLDSYADLIVANEYTEKQKYLTNSHHIIPKIYFKHFNLPIDNNSVNKVNLSIKEHILAHYYLYMCAKEPWFKQANALAILYCKNFSHSNNKIADEELLSLIDNFDTVFLEIKKIAALNLKKNHSTQIGKHLSDETKQKISKAKTNPSNLVRKHLSEAQLGKKQSEETINKRRIKLKEAHKNKETNKYKDVGSKISATKKLNNSGNNRQNKIHIKNYTTGQEKYINPVELDKYIILGFEKFKLKSDPNRPKKEKCKKVICIETGIIYTSIKAAEQQLHIHNIGAVCIGNRNTAGGLHWKFLEN